MHFGPRATCKHPRCVAAMNRRRTVQIGRAEEDANLTTPIGRHIAPQCVECGAKGPIDSISHLCRKCRDADAEKRERRLEAIRESALRVKGR